MHDIYSQTFLYFVSTRWLLGLCTKPLCIKTDADGPLVYMNKSHLLQLYFNIHAKQFELLAVWVKQCFGPQGACKTKLKGAVCLSRLLHVCVFTISITVLLMKL